MRPRWFLGVLVIHVMLGRLPAAEIASHDVYLDLGQAPDAPSRSGMVVRQPVGWRPSPWATDGWARWSTNS